VDGSEEGDAPFRLLKTDAVVAGRKDVLKHGKRLVVRDCHAREGERSPVCSMCQQAMRIECATAVVARLAVRACAGVLSGEVGVLKCERRPWRTP
jgi:hypothetical protein